MLAGERRSDGGGRTGPDNTHKLTKTEKKESREGRRAEMSGPHTEDGGSRWKRGTLGKSLGDREHEQGACPTDPNIMNKYMIKKSLI